MSDDNPLHRALVRSSKLAEDPDRAALLAEVERLRGALEGER